MGRLNIGRVQRINLIITTIITKDVYHRWWSGPRSLPALTSYSAVVVYLRKKMLSAANGIPRSQKSPQSIPSSVTSLSMTLLRLFNIKCAVLIVLM